MITYSTASSINIKEFPYFPLNSILAPLNCTLYKIYKITFQQKKQVTYFINYILHLVHLFTVFNVMLLFKLLVFTGYRIRSKLSLFTTEENKIFIHRS